MTDERRDVWVSMDATGEHCEVHVGMYIHASDMPVSSARKMAENILEKCKDANRVLREMKKREKAGHKGTARYPDRKR